MPHNREPQAKSTMLARGRAVGLAETIEYIRKETRTNTLTSVTYAELEVVCGAFHLYLNTSAARRELDRIRQQVPNDLLQTVCITHGVACRRIKSYFKMQILGVYR